MTRLSGAVLVLLTMVASGSLAAQATPAASLPGGSGFTVSGTGGIDFETTLAAGATLANLDIDLDDADNPGANQTISVTSVTPNPSTPTGVTAPAVGAGTAGATLTISWTGTIAATNAPGNYDFTVAFEDDEGVPNTNSIVVRLILTNAAPVLAGPSGLVDLALGGSDPNFTATIVVGQNLAATFNATDANTGQTLTTTVSVTGGTLTGAQAGFVQSFPFAPTGAVSPHAVSLTGTAANAGTITLTIQVSDGALNDSYTLAITVSAAQVAPVLGAPSGTVDLSVGGSDPNFTATITVGQNLAVTFNATDGNAGDTLTTTVSVTGGTLTGAQAGFVQSFPFAPTGAVSPHAVSLTGTAANAGTITLTVAVADGQGGNDTYTLAITVAAAGTPTISVVGTLTAFSTTGVSIPSAQQSYNVSGSNLTANITITPPTHFQISTTGGGGFTPTNPITLIQTGGTVASTQIFVRYNPTNTSTPHTGNITHASTGATTQNQAVSGNIAAPAAAALSAGSGNPGAQNANPGSTRTALVFRVTETGGGTAYTVTSVSVTVATTNNAAGAAVARIASVTLRRGGTLLGTVTNGGAGWSVVGDNVTVAYTGLSSAVNPATSADFTVSITFTGAAIPTPAPRYVTSVASTGVNGGTAITGTLVSGGQITLAESAPEDPFAEDEDEDDSCDLSTRGGPAWPLALAVALMSVFALVRRRADA